MLLGYGFKNVPTWRVAAIWRQSQARATRGKDATIPLVVKLLKAGKHPSGDE
jgi:hypothetical protein